MKPQPQAVGPVTTPERRVGPGVPLTAIKSVSTRRRLNELCEVLRANRQVINELEAQNKEYMKEVKPILEHLNEDKLLGDTWQAIRVTRTTKTLKPELLLQQGVTLHQIDMATVENESTSFQIRERKVGDDETEEG